MLQRPYCFADGEINKIFPEEWTRAGKSRVWGYAALRQASQMLVLTSTRWNLIDIGVGFLQLFGRATWEVDSFPRLKGATCKISPSLPLGFPLCVSEILDPYFSMYRNVIKRITDLSGTRTLKESSALFPPWYVLRVSAGPYWIHV